MAKESFRFIHASDFHLERPMQDVLDLPDHLKRTLVDAPWKAAAAVFETAVMENVDFIVLAGDLLNPVSSGAQGIAFLLDHFQEMAGRGIQVYWAGGQADDPDRWPEAVSLPANVHLFSKKQVEPHVFRRNGQPLVTLLGRSNDGAETIRAAEYGHEPDDNYAVAVAYGKADLETLTHERIDYWALGGEHQPQTLSAQEPCIRYSGSTQSQTLDESGPHGCVLVDVDAQRNLQTHQVELDLVRTTVQEIDAEDSSLGRDLRQLLARRVARIQSEAAGRHVLVRWRVHMDLENASVVGPSALEELLAWLRREFGYGSPACWSTEIEVLPPKQLPKKWQDEDTILGDFLRVASGHRKQGAKELNLKTLVEGESPGTAHWTSALMPATPSAQLSMLERATLLGVDMLRGHQIDLLAPTRRFGGTDK
jgi:DNA repair protein SbcD/Mre11